MAKSTRPSSADLFCGRTTSYTGMEATGCFDQRHVIGLSMAGRTQYHTPGGIMDVAVGQVSIVDPGTPQHWRVPARPNGRPLTWDTMYVVFRPRSHWLPWLQYPSVQPGYAIVDVTAATRRRMARCLQQVVKLQDSAQELRLELQQNWLEQALLWMRADDRAKRRELDPRVQGALDYLTANLSERLTLTELARRCHTSRARLAALFHEQVGQPPMQYQEHLRLQRAQQMLRLTAEPIAQIAYAVGFTEQRYFSRRFRLFTGMTPSAYRKRTERPTAAPPGT